MSSQLTGCQSRAKGPNLSKYLYIAVRFGLLLFHCISTIIVYIMSNPVFTHILNIGVVNTFSSYILLNDQALLLKKKILLALVKDNIRKNCYV